jgi:valyl-tRNA synthetase
MELAKAYEPKSVEDKWYAEWLERGCFKATPGEGVPYCITIPPPNITGSLHMGHALNNSVIDAMTRWHRMRGFNTLTLPGTDHAGIATQNVVERELAKQGLTRHDLGREKFIARCWEWQKQYGDRIYLQFHKLGCSYDWDRARFTMDASYVDAIYEEFLQWWERGLIYRGARVVNWCPRCQSAISDIEVNSEERAGKLYHFRYPFADGSGLITIATTRPETLLGDTAVAVNPADTRYSDKIGKMLKLPLTDREIPLITDEYARMEFGTGAVKVTPAHDLNDFEAGLRNNLPQIVVIGEDGTMTEAAGPAYAGLDRFEARKRVVADMEALGFLDKIEDYTIQIPLCDRCNTVIEPLLSEQWFAKQHELAAPAMAAVRDGSIHFIPERYERIYLDWMEKIQPWCISRQLWWGHRIPVWWSEDGRNMAARSAEEAAQKLGAPVKTLRQDEDVLDTWFSSGLWPHATLGWPRQTEDLKFWYPTSLLSTAQDIIFLWVARMIMTGLDFMHEIPFKDVYVHPTVLDEKGDRMSKSKGNGVDPLELIEKYGADALRFYLLQHAGMNQDVKFREEGVKLAGQFCNKLWNASRFVLMNLENPTDDQGPTTNDENATANEGSLTPNTQHLTPNVESLTPNAQRPTPDLTTADRWILSRLNRTIAEVNTHLATYDMDDAMRAIYVFLWDEFCDWYLELIKPRLRAEGEERAGAQAMLRQVLETTLRLMHPMIPFITEEIWQALESTTNDQRPTTNDESLTPNTQRLTPNLTIMLAEYPVADESLFDPVAEARMGLVIESTRALRNLRAELGLPPGQRLLAAVVPGNPDAGKTFTDNNDVIVSLARLTNLQIHDTAPSGEGKWVGSPVSGGEVFLEIGEALDVPKELERIDKELASVEKDLAGSNAKLGNEQFTGKAPEAIVAKEREYNASLVEKREKLEARRALLNG